MHEEGVSETACSAYKWQKEWVRRLTIRSSIAFFLLVVHEKVSRTRDVADRTESHRVSAWPSSPII